MEKFMDSSESNLGRAGVGVREDIYAPEARSDAHWYYGRWMRQSDSDRISSDGNTWYAVDPPEPPKGVINRLLRCLERYGLRRSSSRLRGPQFSPLKRR